MKERLAELGYAAGWRLVRALPLPVARAVFTAAADLAYLRKGRGVRRLAGNLRQVVGPELPEPQLRRLVRAGMRSYARYWMEAFRLPTLTRSRSNSGFRLENERAAAGSGAGRQRRDRGAAARGQLGLGRGVGGRQGWPLTTVAERLRPESLYERFVAFREGLGMRIIPTTGGQRTPLELLVEALDKAHIVALLADRDLSARGIDVEFFGARARMPAGPALLALRTAAPLFAVEMWYEADAACAGCGARFRAAAGVDGRAGAGADPAVGRRVRRGDRRPSGGLAHAAAGLAGFARHRPPGDADPTLPS